MRPLKIQRLATALAILTMLTVSACNEKTVPPVKPKATSATAAENDPRAKVLGVEASKAANETPSTTSSAKSDISKTEQANAMPLPGQANDHSTLSPKATQKPAATGR